MTTRYKPGDKVPADDGSTPKRPRPMPNRDEFSKAHKATRRDPDGSPVTDTFSISR